MIRKVVKGAGDPFLLYKRIRENFELSFILESLVGPQRMREHTFIGFDPELVVVLKDGEISVDGQKTKAEDPLLFLRELLNQHAVGNGQEKYIGGLVGFVSYDFVKCLENLPTSNKGGSPFPDFVFGLFTDGIVFNHLTGDSYYFSHGKSRLEDALRSNTSSEDSTFSASESVMEVDSNLFESWVEKAKDEILEGEIFQVVLSRRERATFRGDLMAFYDRLRAINPSPYMYFLDFGKTKIAGSSPEMLVRVEGGCVTTFPIAGTRPLGRDPHERTRLREEMLRDQKERAEHNMLVDLARNDVGKVCKFGSVRVSEYMKVEEFSHVQHIVSKVNGELSPGNDAFDAFASLFPAGTVSGAPKVRAMEIIERLESTRRGPYAGIVGYFSFNGNMDSAITIRSLASHGRDVYLQAGAGIVADSVPEREWMETEDKLRPLKIALRHPQEGKR